MGPKRRLFLCSGNRACYKPVFVSFNTYFYYTQLEEIECFIPRFMPIPSTTEGFIRAFIPYESDILPSI